MPDRKHIFECALRITIDNEQNDERNEEETYDNENELPAPNNEDDEGNNDDNRINDDEYELLLMDKESSIVN